LERGASRAAVLGARSLVEALGAVELGRWVGLGVSIPVLVDESGGDAGRGAAFGDLRLVPRVESLRDGRLGLAALFGLRVPTGDTSRFLGEGMVVFEPRVAAQLYAGMVRVGVNLGVRIREERQYLDLRVGNEALASLALAVVPRPWIDAVL